jgi:hypothetical protein
MEGIISSVTGGGGRYSKLEMKKSRTGMKGITTIENNCHENKAATACTQVTPEASTKASLVSASQFREKRNQSSAW